MAPVTDPQRKKTLAQFRVKINGAPAAKELDQAIALLRVELDIDQPGMFELRIDLDPHNPKWSEGQGIDIGSDVEILVGDASTETSIFKGDVVGLEPIFDEKMPAMVIRGFDWLHKLSRGRHSRAFLNMTDSDIVKKIAADVPGLTAKVDATTITYEHVYQHNQTDLEFLLARARRIGYEVLVTGKELHFRKPAPNGSPIELKWGVNLKRFQARLSSAEQVSEVEVRGWDPKKKESIVGRATKGDGAPAIGEKRTGNDVAKKSWGQTVHYEVDTPIWSQDEANDLAKAKLEEMLAHFITGEAECNGDPKIVPGASVTISGTGKRFDGTYYVVGVRHTITKKDGHRTTFKVRSGRSETLATLLVAPEPRAEAPPVAIGLVTNNLDPDKMARVKVKLPSLYDEGESHWARQASPMGGADRGFLAFPEVNDEVLVAFEHGDPTRPFIIGGLWNGVDKPPEGTAELCGSDGKVNQRIWRSRSGHLFIFDDTDGSEAIRIIDKTGENHIVITSSDNKLDVVLKGDIEIKTDKRITMTAEQDITIESKTGKVQVKGVNLECEATQSAKIGAGSDVEVSGRSSAKLNGAAVDVAAVGTASISGALVKLN